MVVKSEIRISNIETISKSECSNVLNCFERLNFENLNLFRISSLISLKDLEKSRSVLVSSKNLY